MSTTELWVLAETRDGAPTRTTLQLLGRARELAAERRLDLVAVLPGGDETMAAALTAQAPTVLRLTERQGRLAVYEATRLAQALHLLLADRGAPAALLAPASAAGTECLPRLAALIQAPYASAAVAIRWEEDDLVVRRAVYGGRAYEELRLLGAPALATMRAGAYPVPSPLEDAGSVVAATVELPPDLGLEVVGQTAGTGTGPTLAEAATVVAGGRGLGSPAAFALVEQLAQALGGAVGASRSVVDAGWRPYAEQVGKSGATITPELYVACGISGAIHHVLGMNTAGVVVAINTDPDALIFQHADHGIVGDVHEVIPALLESL
jgi:electron transfer flavoprotein alpha subunit